LTSDYIVNPPPIFTPNSYDFDTRIYLDVSVAATVFTKNSGSAGTIFDSSNWLYYISNNDLTYPESGSQNWNAVDITASNEISYSGNTI